jgi:prepilin-type N-terminal cleavage/methylation domain-containing protein
MRSLEEFGARRFGKGNASGFSLVELLIVVAIILIIAAIAIPNLIRAKAAANESVATASIHAINLAEVAYSSANPTIGFAAALADLGPAGSGYLESNLAGGSKSGYNYAYLATGAAPYQGYSLNADPIVRSITGQRSFFSNQDNVTHYDPNAPATNVSPVLQ